MNSVPRSGSPSADLDLSLISPGLRRAAMEAFEEGYALGFLCKAQRGNTDWLWIVEANVGPLRARGIYEQALILAVSSTRTNNHGFPLDWLRYLFGLADRPRLLASGDPLPGPGPFTLYRGVAGRGRARRIRGFSWTADLDLACWFAARTVLQRGGPPSSFESPAVLRGEFAGEDVFAYTNGRQEQEYLVDASKVPVSRALPAATVLLRGREAQEARETWKDREENER